MATKITEVKRITQQEVALVEFLRGIERDIQNYPEEELVRKIRDIYREVDITTFDDLFEYSSITAELFQTLMRAYYNNTQIIFFGQDRKNFLPLITALILATTNKTVIHEHESINFNNIPTKKGKAPKEPQISETESALKKVLQYKEANDLPKVGNTNQDELAPQPTRIIMPTFNTHYQLKNYITLLLWGTRTLAVFDEETIYNSHEASLEYILHSITSAPSSLDDTSSSSCMVMQEDIKDSINSLDYLVITYKQEAKGKKPIYSIIENV